MNVPIQYTESMHALLDWFAEQPCACATIGHISDGTEYSRETVRSNLKQLTAAGHAELRHEPTAEYRLIDDPRGAGSDE
jgi:DNA-binding IclR family transcriptional regulator